MDRLQFISYLSSLGNTTKGTPWGSYMFLTISYSIKSTHCSYSIIAKSPFSRNKQSICYQKQYVNFDYLTTYLRNRIPDNWIFYVDREDEVFGLLYNNELIEKIFSELKEEALRELEEKHEKWLSDIGAASRNNFKMNKVSHTYFFKKGELLKRTFETKISYQGTTSKISLKV